MRIGGDTQNLAGSSERNIPAVVIFYNLRIYILTVKIGMCVQMGDKSQPGV